LLPYLTTCGETFGVEISCKLSLFFAREPQKHNVGTLKKETSGKKKRFSFLGVLGLARTGLIFTGLQEGAQPGGGG